MAAKSIGDSTSFDFGRNQQVRCHATAPHESNEPKEKSNGPISDSNSSHSAPSAELLPRRDLRASDGHDAVPSCPNETDDRRPSEKKGAATSCRQLRSVRVFLLGTCGARRRRKTDRLPS